jgi:hypothetical protein
MPLNLLSYLRDDCHKQVVLISESYGDSNRYTPYRGKPNQHITHFPHSVRVWPSTIRISRGPHIAIVRESPTDLDGSHCSREHRDSRLHPQHIGWSINGSPSSFSLLTANETVGLSQPSVDDKLLGLLDPYTSMWSVRSTLAHGGQPISP